MITTGVQLAILGGAMVGSGVAGLVWRIAPARPAPRRRRLPAGPGRDTRP